MIAAKKRPGVRVDSRFACTPAERKRRSRAYEAAGYRLTRCGFPINDDTISALVRTGLIDIADTEQDDVLVEAIGCLLDQFVLLKPETLRQLVENVIELSHCDRRRFR